MSTGRQFIQINLNKLNMEKQKQGIKISDVLNLMKTGYTRTAASANYKEDIGSVQSHYQLSDYESKMLFKLPALKNAKTSMAEPVNFFIIKEDTADVVNESTEQVVTPVAIPGISNESGLEEVNTPDEPVSTLSFTEADLEPVLDESTDFSEPF